MIYELQTQNLNMFRLTQKSDYGLILLSSLAKYVSAGPVSNFLPAYAKASVGRPASRRSAAVPLEAKRSGVGNSSIAATRKPISISFIARKNKLSTKFLSQVAVDLKKAGFIASKEGVSGGYTLAKQAKEIKVLDVLKVLDGELVKGECFEDDHECLCGAKDMWEEMKEQMEETIGKKTVADLVA